MFWNECLVVLVIVFIPSAKSYRPKNLIVAEKVRQFNAAVQTNSWFDVVNFFCAIQLPSIHNVRTFSCKNERNYILLAGRHDSISGLIDNNT